MTLIRRTDVLFRADASDLIGSGHVMRCLSLAGAIRARGKTALFVARSLPSALQARVRAAGHEVVMLGPDGGQNDRPLAHAHWLAASWQADAAATRQVADAAQPQWIVVDHYGLDAPWEAHLAAPGRQLAAIDDLADRPHATQLLLDQNFHSEDLYAPLTPPGCRLLLGPRYALLRPEFATAAAERTFAGSPLSYLVAFSGADLAHQALLAVTVLAQTVRADDRVQVVINRQNADLPVIAAIADQSGFALTLDATALAPLMDAADIAIGAGGGMLWERAARGLPAVAIAIADNQRAQVKEAAARGMVLAADCQSLTADGLHQMVESLRADPLARERLSRSSRKTVDGRGAVRVAQHLFAPPLQVRRATTDDAGPLLTWRNDVRIRRVSRNAQEIAPDDHWRWLARVLNDSARHVLVVADEEGPAGVVRFDDDGGTAEVSIYLVPERLGSGLGASVLLAAESWLAGQASEIVRLRAHVLPGNLASEELFRACGYRRQGEDFFKPLRSPP